MYGQVSASQWVHGISSRANTTPSYFRNKVNFFLHDEERFFKYLENVAEGKKKLSCATLLPHELVIEACRTQADWKMAARLPGDKLARMLDVDGRVVDAQWKTLLASIRDASRSGEGLTNSIAVVDVSGSMGQLGASRDKNNPYPIDVAIALGLLTAQLAEEPFNGAFITFSAEPQIVRLPKGQSLRQLVKGMSHANWGMNTDIVKVFQLLLDIAVNNDLKKEQMIKRVSIPYTTIALTPPIESKAEQEPLASSHFHLLVLTFTYSFWTLLHPIRFSSLVICNLTKRVKIMAATKSSIKR